MAKQEPRRQSTVRDSSIRVRDELRDTLILAGPIVLNQVGHMSMGLVDTMVAGRIGTTSLAGIGLASSFFWTFTNICMGCLLGLDTWFSQAAGARDDKSLHRYFSQSMWSSVIMTVLSLAGVLIGTFFYMRIAAPSPTRDAFFSYITMVNWCIPTLFFHFVIQRYWQARHTVVPFVVIVVGANVLNLFGNLAFGLGMWGFPRLEVQGLALSTVICRYVMLAAAVGFTVWQLAPGKLAFPRFEWPVQKSIFKLGWPAAGHVALEMGAFTIATFLVGMLGSVPLAAHHICVMMSAFTFMFPLGFSAAAAVRVGRFIGAGQPEHARLAGWLCIGLSVATMSCFALGFLTFPGTIMGWYTNDPAVIKVGSAIFLIVALFQIADGTQVSTTGALRGLGNTHSAMVANFIGHYPIGLTLGVVLAFVLKLGVIGMWWGLAAGLISVATLVLWRWRYLTRDLSRLKRLQGE